MSPQGGQGPIRNTAQNASQIAHWIATGEPSHTAVLRALADVLTAVADHTATSTGLSQSADVKEDAMQDPATVKDQARFVAPALPADASTDDIALWLADTRTRAHQLIDESVTAAHEVLNKRATASEEDATAQAQRHAQRLAIERLRRAVADLTLEVRGVHGRLDRMEALLRQFATAPTAERDRTEPWNALATPPAALAASTSAIVAAEQVEEPGETPAAPLEESAPRARASLWTESPRESIQPSPAVEAIPADESPVATSALAETVEATQDTGSAHTMQPSDEPEAVVQDAADRLATERASEPESAPASELPAEDTSEATPAPATADAPLTDARAAVEAAVASALQEARRAASESAAPRGNRPVEPSEPAPARWERAAEQPSSPEPDATTAVARADRLAGLDSEERALAWATRATSEPDTAAQAAPAETLSAPEARAEASLQHAAESPRAFLGAPAEESSAAEEIEAPTQALEAPPAIEHNDAPTAPIADSTTDPGESPAAGARPGLWVPPSAIAPPRAVPRPTPPPQQAPAPSEDPTPAVAPPEQAIAGYRAGQGPRYAPTMAPERPAAPVPAYVSPPPAREPAMAAQPHADPAGTSLAHESGVFYPDGGPVILRISPISGFQGLMRVQDSVVQLPAVREATVEAYARGEARLRLQLVAALEPSQLSQSLTSSLGMRAGLQSLSDEERSIQIALG